MRFCPANIFWVEPHDHRKSSPPAYESGLDRVPSMLPCTLGECSLCLVVTSTASETAFDPVGARSPWRPMRTTKFYQPCRVQQG